MKHLWPLLVLLVLFGQCKKNDNGGTGPLPVLSANTVSAPEGNGGTTKFNFVFTLSAASSQQVSVTVKTTDGFAKAGEDYTAIDQVLTFAPGETSKTLSVNIVADDIREGKDDFTLGLTNAQNCTLSTGFYRNYIENDDTKVPITEDGYSTPNTYPGLSLVWADEFNGASLNTTDWNYETGDGCPGVCGWGNNELEWYTNGENVTMQSGKLVIEAREESRGGKNYTSTRITTKNKQPFKYGRVDIRAKLPYGQGIWPALWMMPQDNVYGGWPTSGEMDIMELLGHEPNKVYSTVHYGPGPGSRNISKSIVGAAPYSNAFHVYSMVWELDRVRFYVDDVLISDIKKADLAGNIYPYNEKFFFIFNLAVGGAWPGNPDLTTYFPQWLIVDYIRVFQ